MQNHTLAIGDRLRRLEGVQQRAGLAVEQGNGGPPLEPGSRLPSEDVGFGRLLELHMRKSRMRAESLFFPQYFGRQRDFGLAERIERMTGHHAGRWLCAYHIGPNSPEFGRRLRRSEAPRLE